MGFRISTRTTVLLALVAVALMSSSVWAVYYELGPSQDEWGLKYEGNVTLTKEGKLNVAFTLLDEGRLKSIHSVHVFALSNPTPDGSRTYYLKAPMPMTPNQEGKLSGQLQINRDLLDYARVRIFSYTVDGQPQRMGVRYYDIPIRKLVKKPAVAAAPRAPGAVASPPAVAAPAAAASPPAVASPPVTNVKR